MNMAFLTHMQRHTCCSLLGHLPSLLGLKRSPRACLDDQLLSTAQQQERAAEETTRDRCRYYLCFLFVFCFVNVESIKFYSLLFYFFSVKDDKP